MATQNQGWLWDPYQTLDLTSLRTDYGPFFCVGFSDSYEGKPGCGWSIGREVRLEARQKLDAMAVQQPQSQAVTAMLKELVHFLLCTTHHQQNRKQRDVRLSDWSARIRECELTLRVNQLEAELRGYQDRLRQEDIEATRLRSDLQQVRHQLQNKKTLLQEACETIKTRDRALQSAADSLEETRRQLDESKQSRIPLLLFGRGGGGQRDGILGMGFQMGVLISFLAQVWVWIWVLH
ncbi:hypothetical protein MMC07_003921 [Pseudocyphellaria aurata]|nr:hypothetical protein [Pseudocyphellaria aurata]